MRTRSHWLTLAALGAALVMAPAVRSAIPGLPTLEVLHGSWGSGDVADIAKVVRAVAAEFPGAVGPPPSIRIRHRFGGPRIGYDRDRDGWLVMYLSARDDRWYQYVYQFAHEYCHLLARFDRKAGGGDIVRQHQWFEESLCETASLFALRALGEKWCGGESEVLFRNAAPQLRQYAYQLLQTPRRWLDPGTDFAAWYARNQDALAHDPYLRDSNELVAAQLLPLFEKDRQRWAALAYLHPAEPVPGEPFPEFLASWEAATPASLKPVVAEIRVLFDRRQSSTARRASEGERPSSQAATQAASDCPR